MDTVKIERDAHYYHFNQEMVIVLHKMVAKKHYPHRVTPNKWPDMKLIGKAMVKGWAEPCLYYPRPWRRGGYCRSFVFPGISDKEMMLIHAIMQKE